MIVALIVLASILLVTERFCNPPRLVIVAFTALIVFVATTPLTVIADKLPRLVILFCAVCDKVPLNVPPLITPGTVKLLILPDSTLSVLEVIFPATVRLTKVPSVVIFV